MIDHGGADDESVAEMHGWHCGEGIDKVSAHPDGCGFVVADGVEETIFGWEKARGHAGIQGEC